MFANLSGKVSLITGSTSGIGLATARVLASAGSKICLTGFGDKDKIEEARSSIEKDYSVKAIYSPGDFRKWDSIKELVSNCVKNLGNVDVLVNNAGI